MPSPTISPILADLSQDIAGSIPLELILLWNTSDKTDKKHLELLEPNLRTGHVVSSDSAGLSKLSGQRELVDVMQLVSTPKEIIYAYGKAAGGQEIGLWVADNTQMFYGSQIKSEDIIEAMIAAQHEIKEQTVQVGVGIHYGEFIEIGGGLYGHDAIHIEELTESHTQGGAIAITHKVREKLSQHFHQHLSSMPNFQDVYLLDYSGLKPNLTKHTTSQYPYPFNSEFFEFLKSYESLSQDTRQNKLSSFTKNTNVVLLKIAHLKQNHLLEELTQYIVANAYVNQLLKQFPQINLVKSNGDLGIFVGSDAQAAIEFSKALHLKLTNNNFSASIGIAAGEVLLFPLQNGFEIAGGPVNLASKIAEDSGMDNKILVHESVDFKPKNTTPFSFKISSIDINGSIL